MSIRVFLELVEIRTKLASLFPFVIGVLFSLTYFEQISWRNSAIFFCGMLVFDMTTTAINNAMDFQKAKSQTYKYQENIIGRAGISPSVVYGLIFFMLLFSAAVGVFLSLETGWLMLLMGGSCCLIGIFYTFGPVPLSRMPLGEVFSGVTMGLGIFAMTVYLNVLQPHPFFLDLHFSTGVFLFSGNMWAVGALILASVPMVLTIANIMLANNLRDLEADIHNHRYTLVYYIGRANSVQLFQFLMYACYAAIVLGLLLGVYEWPILLIFTSWPFVKQQLRLFKEEVPHPKSFGRAIHNLVAFNSSYILGLLGILIKKAL